MWRHYYVIVMTSQNFCCRCVEYVKLSYLCHICHSCHISWCMIKIFQGAGVVTPSKPPPPYEQLLPLPTPCFKMFLERSLNDPPPPHFKHLSLLPPTLSTTLSPLKILIIHMTIGAIAEKS